MTITQKLAFRSYINTKILSLKTKKEEKSTLIALKKNADLYNAVSDAVSETYNQKAGPIEDFFQFIMDNWEEILKIILTLLPLFMKEDM